MPTGLRIRNDDGVLQIDESFKCLSLITKGTARAVGVTWGHRLREVDVTYPSDAIVFGLHSPGYAPNLNLKLVGQGATVRNGNGSFTTRVYVCWLSATSPSPDTFDIEWFAFGAPRLTPSPYGLNVRNAAGELVYSSNAKTMNVVGFAAPPSGSDDEIVAAATTKPIVAGFVGSVAVNSGVDTTTAMEYIEYYEAVFSGFYCQSGGVRVRNHVVFQSQYNGAPPADPANGSGINGPGSYYSRPIIIDGSFL